MSKTVTPQKHIPRLILRKVVPGCTSNGMYFTLGVSNLPWFLKKFGQDPYTPDLDKSDISNFRLFVYMSTCI